MNRPYTHNPTLRLDASNLVWLLGRKVTRLEVAARGWFIGDVALVHTTNSIHLVSESPMITASRSVCRVEPPQT